MRKTIGLFVVVVIALCARSAEAAFNVRISDEATINGSFSGGVFTPTADNAVFNATELRTALASGNVTIVIGSGGTQFGDVTFPVDIIQSLGGFSDFTVNAARNIILLGGFDLPNKNVLLNSGGTVSINTNVITRSLTIQDPVNLTGDATLSAVTTMTLNGTLNGAVALALTAATLTVNDDIGNITPLTTLAVGGDITLNGGVIRTSGLILFLDNVVLGVPTTMTVSGAAPIDLRGTVNGDALTLNASLVHIQDEVGDVTPLSNLAISGTANLSGGNLRISGPVLFSGPVVLLSALNIVTTSGNVAFGSTLNGAHELSLSTPLIIFNGVVGGSTPPTVISSDVGNLVYINTTALTVGDFFYTIGPVSLLTGVTIRTTNPGGHIEFQGPINGAGGLALNSTTARFAAPIGVGTSLALLSVGMGGAVDLDGGPINTTIGMTFSGPVTLGAAATLNVSDPGGSVLFAGPLSGGHDLTVNAFATRFFTNAVGAPNPLGVLTTSGFVEFTMNTTVKVQRARFNGGLSSVLGPGRTLTLASPEPLMGIGTGYFFDPRALANGFSQLTYGDAGTQILVVGETIWQDPVVFLANASGAFGTGEVEVIGPQTRVDNSTFIFDTRTLRLRAELLPDTAPPYYVHSMTVPAGLPPVALNSPTYWKVNASAGVFASTLELAVCRVPMAPGIPRYWDGAQWQPVAFVDLGGCPLITLTTGSVPPLIAAATDLYFAVGGSLFDPNGDSLVTITDAFYLVNFLFAGGPVPIGSGDADGSGAVNVLDIFHVLLYLFAAGPPPV